MIDFYRAPSKYLLVQILSCLYKSFSFANYYFIKITFYYIFFLKLKLQFCQILHSMGIDGQSAMTGSPNISTSVASPNPNAPPNPNAVGKRFQNPPPPNPLQRRFANPGQVMRMPHPPPNVSKPMIAGPQNTRGPSQVNGEQFFIILIIIIIFSYFANMNLLLFY